MVLIPKATSTPQITQTNASRNEIILTNNSEPINPNKHFPTINIQNVNPFRITAITRLIN